MLGTAWEWILIAIRTYCYYYQRWGINQSISPLARVLLWQPQEEAGEGAATEKDGVARYPLTLRLSLSCRLLSTKEKKRGKLFLVHRKDTSFMLFERRASRVPKLFQSHDCRAKNDLYKCDKIAFSPYSQKNLLIIFVSSPREVNGAFISS